MTYITEMGGVEAAQDLLGYLDEPGFHAPGDFVCKVLDAMFHADMGNLAAFGSAFPALAAAVFEYKYEEGGTARLKARAAR